MVMTRHTPAFCISQICCCQSLCMIAVAGKQDRLSISAVSATHAAELQNMQCTSIIEDRDSDARAHYCIA